MKNFLLFIFCLTPFLVSAQAEMTAVAETVKIHGHHVKLDVTLYDKGGAKFVGIDLSTIYDVGCVADTGLILYLANGAEVDGILQEGDNTCGNMIDNKEKFGGKVNRHAEYHLMFALDPEDLEDLRTYQIEAIDIEGEHMTIERKASDFQEMSREHFTNYLMVNLKK